MKAVFGVEAERLLEPIDFVLFSELNDRRHECVVFRVVVAPSIPLEEVVLVFTFCIAPVGPPARISLSGVSWPLADAFKGPRLALVRPPAKVTADHRSAFVICVELCTPVDCSRQRGTGEF